MADLRNYTYGCEHELSDVDRNTKLPDGCYWDDQEQDIVNSDGRAIQPRSKTYTIGGEINTRPTDTPEGQAVLFREALSILPNATINHRAHLHCHISYPELKESLEDQKRILTYVVNNSQYMLDSIFSPTKHPSMNTKAWKYQIADRTIMQDWKYKFCMESDTTREFKESHQKVKDGRILPQTTKRYAINLFSIHKHGTIEMRCLFPTMKPVQVCDSLKFLRDFMNHALSEDQKPLESWVDWSNYNLPKELPYNHEIELGWQETNTKV